MFNLRILNCDKYILYLESNDNTWSKYIRDSKNFEIYHENSSGYWNKHTYDEDHYLIYYENSKGAITMQPKKNH